MPRYLMTHSLLSSWLYAIKENPFEDMTTERDPYAEFLQVLNREPTGTTEAMRKGIDFEDLVTSIVYGCGNPLDNLYDAACKVATFVKNCQLQLRTSKEIKISGLDIVLHGRLDALGAGVIYDIKFSSSYDVGKYISSTQHPTYFELVPEAKEFTYLVSNGTYVWPETYRRDETPSIIPTIAEFLEWLEMRGLLDLYKEKWLAQ